MLYFLQAGARGAAQLANLTEPQQRAVQRLLHNETRKQENLEDIFEQATPQITAEAKPEDVDDDFIYEWAERASKVSDCRYVVTRGTSSLASQNWEEGDVRQRVLYKMNGYEQYCFASSYSAMLDEIDSIFEEASDDDRDTWLRIAEKLKSHAQQYWKSARGGGIAGESGRAHAEALALLSLRASANGYVEAEAKTLSTDIANFEAKIVKFNNEHEDLYDMIPKE